MTFENFAGLERTAYVDGGLERTANVESGSLVAAIDTALAIPMLEMAAVEFRLATLRKSRRLGRQHQETDSDRCRTKALEPTPRFQFITSQKRSE